MATRRGQKATTLGTVNAAIACGAKTLLVPECGHAFTEMRWEPANAFGNIAISCSAHH
jgi:hypothetical protein